MRRIIKQFLEDLKLVRLVWITESWKHEGYRSELRIVRTHGASEEPWCWNTGESNYRVRLLPDGKCKSKYRCTWEPYNKRSPQLEGFRTLDKKEEKKAADWHGDTND